MRFLQILCGCLLVTGATIQLGDTPQNLNTPHAVHEIEQALEFPGDIVIDMVDGSTEQDLNDLSLLLGADLNWVHPLSRDEGLIHGFVPNMAEAISLLSTMPTVEVSERNETMTVQGWLSSSEPNDPLYSKQWHLPAMGADISWATTPQGKGVIVAVLDTGVSRVEDLDSARLLEGVSFVPGQSVSDGNGHGTHVAGTIAQSTNNGIGVAGVAPQATVLPVKVLSDQGSGQVAWIAAGIDYAVDEGAQVINMSLGGGYSEVIHNAVKKARKAGVLVVAACGNSDMPQCGYPGGLEESIGVSSTGPDGKRAFYSSYGKGVDIAAPGGNKRMTDGGVWQNTVLDGKEGYYDFQGTSMASPHVAGAAAVLLSTGMSSDLVESTLLETADGDEWTEEFGHGHLNLQAALGGAGSVSNHDGMILSGSAIAFAMLIGLIGRARKSFVVTVALVAALMSGGGWFLTFLPLPNWLIFNYLTTSPLAWPNLLFSPGVASFPLWLSVLLPVGFAFVTGPNRAMRPVATGLLLGYSSYFVWGIATSSLTVAYLPGTFGIVWLAANAIFSTFFAVGLVGVETLDDE